MRLFKTVTNQVVMKNAAELQKCEVRFQQHTELGKLASVLRDDCHVLTVVCQ